MYRCTKTMILEFINEMIIISLKQAFIQNQSYQKFHNFTKVFLKVASSFFVQYQQLQKEGTII